MFVMDKFIPAQFSQAVSSSSNTVVMFLKETYNQLQIWKWCMEVQLLQADGLERELLLNYFTDTLKWSVSLNSLQFFYTFNRSWDSAGRVPNAPYVSARSLMNPYFVKYYPIDNSTYKYSMSILLKIIFPNLRNIPRLFLVCVLSRKVS